MTTVTKGVPDCKHFSVRYERPLFRPTEIESLRGIDALEEEGNPEMENVDRVITTDPERPLCAQLHTQWAASIMAFWSTEPVCTTSGYFVDTRCEYIRGYCICVDPTTGDDIEDSKVYSTTIDCTEESRSRIEGISNVEGVGIIDAAVATVSPNGCNLDEKYYTQGQIFLRDCNICTCHGLDVVECTIRVCHLESCRMGETAKAVEHLIADHCHVCACENGAFACRVTECTEHATLPENVLMCDNKPPQTHYYAECNSCYCPDSGVPFCTMKECYTDAGSCYVNHRNYLNGKTFTRGCDTLRCSNGVVEVVQSCLATIVDGVITGASPKVACTYGIDKYYNGESMLLGDNLCNCKNFEWDCQPINHIVETVDI